MKQILNRAFGLRGVLTLLALTVVLAATAQNKITGKVTDENNQPAIGANVVVKGTTQGVSTDLKGTYTLSVKKGAVLVFSYLGYKSQEVTVNTQTVIDVKLEPETNVMDEVVVVGYGAQKRSDLTGAIASVSAEDVEGFKSGSVMEALGGQIAGVQITATDGTPGAGFDIKIRGIGSVNGETTPLYIVDGFQVDNIDYLSNLDIASIEVLKDASSSAIYGSRAANGVVMVTTKAGKEGRPVVTYNGSASYRQISKTLDLLSPYEFVKLQTEAWPDKFGETYYKSGNDSNGIPYRYQSIDDYIGVGGIDWQGETFQPTWSQDHNVSISGGSDRTKYAFSFSDFLENGIFKNSAFNKITAKMRVNHKISKLLSIDATVNYAFTDKRGMGTSGDNGRFNMQGQIPIKQAESVTNTTKAEMWSGNLALNFDFGKGWSFRTAGSYNTTNRRYYQFYYDGSKEAYRNGQTPYGATQMTRDVRWTNFNYLTYKYKQKNGHAFDVMLGQETSFRGTEYLKGQSTDFPFDNLGNNNLGLGATPSQVTSSRSDNLLVSFFARGNYSYKDRYLFTATIRADGSTVFSKNNKWGYFPSFSAAWRISEEPFMKKQDVISNLKLRAGWGIVGNDRITNYLSLTLYSQGKYGYGNSVVTVLSPKQLPNENLKWEASQSTNIGIDLGLFRNRLNITADVFLKDTKDLLMEANKANVSGFKSQWQNVGKIRNKGLELAINSTNIASRSGFRWTTDFNISFIRNELRALANGDASMGEQAGWNSDYTNDDYTAFVGQSLGLIYGYAFDGVYQSSDFEVDAATGEMHLRPGVADMSEHYTSGTFGPGVVKYKDVDGDGKITTNDRTVIGNGTPKWYGGITNTFSYKGIDLSFMFQFNYGNDVYNATRMYASQSQDQRANMMAEVADRWTATNASNRVPRWDGYVKNELYSRFIEDGSFLRLKSVTLGYTLPQQWTRKFYVSKLRIYFSGQNLFVVTGYSGYDPEVNMRASNPMTPSFDWGAYPRSKVYTVGLDVTF